MLEERLTRYVLDKFKENGHTLYRADAAGQQMGKDNENGEDKPKKPKINKKRPKESEEDDEESEEESEKPKGKKKKKITKKKTEDEEEDDNEWWARTQRILILEQFCNGWQRCMDNGAQCMSITFTVQFKTMWWVCMRRTTSRVPSAI